MKPKAKAAPKLSAAKKSTMTGRAVKRTRKTAPPAAPVAALDPAAFHEAVARLAYQLWEQRGRPDSSAEIDWFRAEEEIGRPSLGVKAFRAEHNATLRVDLTYEFSSWLIRIASRQPVSPSTRCFRGPPELEKAKEWALGLAQWQVEHQNLGVPVPEELNWEAASSE